MLFVHPQQSRAVLPAVLRAAGHRLLRGDKAVQDAFVQVVERMGVFEQAPGPYARMRMVLQIVPMIVQLVGKEPTSGSVKFRTARKISAMLCQIMRLRDDKHEVVNTALMASISTFVFAKHMYRVHGGTCPACCLWGSAGAPRMNTGVELLMVEDTSHSPASGN
jgi:hypothetical protein